MRFLLVVPVAVVLACRSPELPPEPVAEAHPDAAVSDPEPSDAAVRDPARREAPVRGGPVVVLEGMRAVSIRLDDSAPTVAVVPGGYVDVMVATPAIGGASATLRTVLRDVKVLQLSDPTWVAPDGRLLSSTIVTLLLTKEQSEELVMASRGGRYRIAPAS